MPEARSHHVAVAVGSAMYVLDGLRDGGGIMGNYLKFESTQGTWSAIAPAPQHIYKSAAVAVDTDIYVFGGENEESDDSDSVIKYDTVADV
jgi:hypothetical protein